MALRGMLSFSEELGDIFLYNWDMLGVGILVLKNKTSKNGVD